MGFFDPLFEMRPNMPLDNLTAIVCLMVAYPVLMSVVAALKPAKPLTLRWVSFLHNVLLFLYSVHGVGGFASVMWRNFQLRSVDALTFVVCDTSHAMSAGENLPSKR